MNSLDCVSEFIRSDEMFFEEDTAEIENLYTTVPMPVIEKPICQRPDEEELHASFEEAISERLLALHDRLNSLSSSVPVVKYSERNTDTVFSYNFSVKNISVAKKREQNPSTDCRLTVHTPLAWRRTTLFICSSMAFMLFGFDLLGVLMLHIH